MLATCSVDKTVTLWDTYNEEEKLTNGTPKAKMNKDMKVGKLYTLSFYPSSPWLLGCAGGGMEMALWDMTRDEHIQKCFGGRTTSTIQVVESSTQEKQEAFDAMMTNKSEGMSAAHETDSRKKKDKSKKKKKVHRAGR
jgi:hypothetical protein